MKSKIQRCLIQINKQKHIAWSYGYKLVSVDDMFSKIFKTYLGENAVHNFINSMI